MCDFNALICIDDFLLVQYIENVPYTLEKNVSPAVVGSNTLHNPLSIESSWYGPSILYACLFLSACSSNY